MTPSKKNNNGLLVEVTVCIEKDGNSYYAFSPTLPGFHIDGETKEEIQKNARDGVMAYIISMIKHNEPLPLNRVIEKIPKKAFPMTFTERIPVPVPA